MKRPNIELCRLRHVVAAAEHGSFPRAAAALTNRAPSALARWSAEILQPKDWFGLGGPYERALREAAVE